MNEILVNIHPDLAEMVSGATGIAVAPAGTPEAPTPSAPTPSGPLHKDAAKLRSPALSMDKAPPAPSLIGRKVAVLLDDGADAKEVQSALAAFAEAGLVAETIGNHHGGTVATSGNCSRSTARHPMRRRWSTMPYSFRPALVQALPRSRWRSVSSMKRIVTASRFPWRQTARRFCMQPASRQRPMASRSAKAPELVGDLVKNLGQHRFPRRVSVLKPS